MRHPTHLVLASLMAAGILACADAPTSTSASVTPAEADARGSEGRGVFHRYVAIGTSISMGVQSDGVYATTQETSWPAQLARLAHRELSLPRIAFPGCGSPLAAPLASGRRLSGEAAGAPLLTRQCAPNEPGVTLPAGNVAVDGARTGHALTATPENPDPAHATQYSRVLPPGMTQLSAMEAQNPKVVSVELGANDVLGAATGVYLPGITVVPTSVWASQYRQVVDRVDRAAKHAVLVGLLDDVRNFPSFRSGAELWAASATFAPFNVKVSEDCKDSQNLLFVAVRVPVAVGTGVAYAKAGLGPHTLSCANAPSSSGFADYVLGPDDVAALNAQLVEMSAIIRGEAEARGFAYFALGELYEEANVKAPFSAITLMTTAEPYGPLMSLDGLHPSAAGATVLADAAARALNARYRFGIPTSSGAAVLFAER